MLISNVSHQTFMLLARARVLATQLQKEDSELTYQVTPENGNEQGLAGIVILDTDGTVIGAL